MEHRTLSPRGDPIVASVFQEKPLINLTATVHDEAPAFLGKGCLPRMLFLVDDVLLDYRYSSFWIKHKDAPVGVASSDNLSYLSPPVNQIPSLALGHLIYWGLPHGTPFG